jgi:hypothetical protein
VGDNKDGNRGLASSLIVVLVTLVFVLPLALLYDPHLTTSAALLPSRPRRSLNRTLLLHILIFFLYLHVPSLLVPPVRARGCGHRLVPLLGVPLEQFFLVPSLDFVRVEDLFVEVGDLFLEFLCQRLDVAFLAFFELC